VINTKQLSTSFQASHFSAQLLMHNLEEYLLFLIFNHCLCIWETQTVKKNK